MSEWKEVILGEIASITDCEHKTAPTVGFSDYYSVRTSNISNGKIDLENSNRVSESTYLEWTKRLTPQFGDIVLAREAPVGEVGWIPENKKVCLGQRTVLIRILDQTIEPKYILYLLSTDNTKYELTSQSTGSVVAHLNVENIKKLQLQVHASLSTQHSIANILSSLDDKIDLLHRQNVTLEKMAETLFRQWFVEDAKEDWRIGSINDLIEIQSGFAFNSSCFVEMGMFKLITIKNVQDGYIDTSRTDFISEIPTRMPTYCHLKQGDILLSLTGNVGRCGLVSDDNLLLNQRVAKLKPKNSRDWAYAYTFFRKSSTKRLLEELSKGTAQANLSPIETGKLEIQIPPEEILQVFSNTSTSLIEKILKNKIQIRTLTSLRDTLLPKLMSGEVRVMEKITKFILNHE